MYGIFNGVYEHITINSSINPIENHTCHFSVCKRLTEQPNTHVAFFNQGYLVVDKPQSLNRQPINDESPHGTLEFYTCAHCESSILLDDKLGPIRALVPNNMALKKTFLPPHITHFMMLPLAFLGQMTDARCVRGFGLILYSHLNNKFLIKRDIV